MKRFDFTYIVSRYRRLVLSTLLCFLVLFLVSGCTVLEPDQESSSNLGENIGDIFSIDDADGTTNTPIPQITPAPSRNVSIVSYGDVGNVEVYYNATQSMMGFADTPTISTYEKALDAIEASIAQCFPNAQKHFFHVDMDQEKSKMLLSGDRIVHSASSPSFYILHKMTTLPGLLKRKDSLSIEAGTRMVSFIDGYYPDEAIPSSLEQLTNPTYYAVNIAETGKFSVFVTDLNELQYENGNLIRILKEKSFDHGDSIAILGVYSEYSGLIPIYGNDTTWYEWGDLPTGAQESMLDFGDYKIGVAADLAARSFESRPFYIICIGQSNKLNDFLAVVQDQIEKSANVKRNEQMYTQVFDNSYVVDHFQIEKCVSVVNGNRNGVNLLSQSSQNALWTVQLQKVQGNNPRYMIVQMSYPSKDSDPRTNSFIKSDFQVAYNASLVSTGEFLSQDDLMKQGFILDWDIANVGNGVSNLLIRNVFPDSGVLSRNAQYIFTISITFNPPSMNNVLPWVKLFDMPIETQTLLQSSSYTFDGSRTIGLANFVSSIAGLQSTVLQPVSLGSFSYQIDVAY
jgi:hypothetical protein